MPEMAMALLQANGSRRARVSSFMPHLLQPAAARQHSGAVPPEQQSNKQRGLTPAEIAQLGEARYEGRKVGDEGETEVCAICLCEFQRAAQVRRLRCQSDVMFGCGNAGTAARYAKRHASWRSVPNQTSITAALHLPSSSAMSRGESRDRHASHIATHSLSLRVWHGCTVIQHRAVSRGQVGCDPRLTRSTSEQKSSVPQTFVTSDGRRPPLSLSRFVHPSTQYSPACQPLASSAAPPPPPRPPTRTPTCTQ